MPIVRIIVAVSASLLLAASCGESGDSTPSGDADAVAEAPPAEPVDASQPEPSVALDAEQDDPQPEAPSVSEPEQPTEDADTTSEGDEPATTEPVASAEPEPVEQPESTTTLPELDTEQVPVADPLGWCAGIQGVLDHFEVTEEALEAAYARSSEAWEAYDAALGMPEEAEAFKAAEAADNEVFEAQYQMEVANSLREELVESGRMSTGDDPESLAFQRAWAALVAADPNIAELSARVPQDIAIGLDFAVPPLVIPEGATDEEAEALEAAWRTNRRRLIEDTNELRVAIWSSFASGTMSAYLQSLEESCELVAKLSVSDDHILEGDSVVLRYTALNGVSQTITDVGDIPSGPNLTITVTPPSRGGQGQTYLLTVVAADGSTASDAAYVQVLPAPTIRQFEFDSLYLRDTANNQATVRLLVEYWAVYWECDSGTARTMLDITGPGGYSASFGTGRDVLFGTGGLVGGNVDLTIPLADSGTYGPYSATLTLCEQVYGTATATFAYPG